MKNLFTFLLIVFSTVAFAQTTYYSCTGSSPDVSTSLTGTPCNTPFATANVAGNSLVISAGTTVNAPTPSVIFNFAQIDVYGELNLGGGNGTSTLPSGGKIIVHNGGSIRWIGNRNFIIAQGAILTIEEGGELNFAGTTQLSVGGIVTGSGFACKGNASITDIGGKINGLPGPWPCPLDLSDFGFVWQIISPSTTPQWTSSTTNAPIAAPNDVSARAIFRANFSLSDYAANGWVAGRITIDATYSVEVNDDRSVIVEINNNGTLALINDARIGTLPSGLIGTGSIRLKRVFTSIETDWTRMGFPVKPGATFSNVMASSFWTYSGTPQQNSVYVWNETNSNWELPLGTTPLYNNPFTTYPFNLGDYVEVTVPNAELNNGTQTQTINYHNGTGSSTPFVNTVIDGWNLMYNPFMAYLDWNTVITAMTPAQFQHTAVYVWNGNNYEAYNNGGFVNSAGTNPATQTVGNARYIAPFQGFFVQVASGVTGQNFSFTNDMRTTNPGAPVASFKNSGNNLVLDLKGDGKTMYTELVQNTAASNSFDGNFDAYYLPANADMPAFYTKNNGTTRYALNQFPEIDNIEIPLAFTYPTNGKAFTISINPACDWASNKKVFIKDLYTNQTRQLTAKKGYTFMSNTSAPEDRFVITFKQTGVAGVASLLNVDDNNFELGTVWFTDDMLNVSMIAELDGATVEVYNIAGQMVASKYFNSLKDEQIKVEGTGFFVIHISTKDGVFHVMKAMKN